MVKFIQIVAKESITSHFGDYTCSPTHMLDVIFKFLENDMQLNFDKLGYEPHESHYIFIKVYCEINKIKYEPFKKELLEKIQVSFKAYKENYYLHGL